tara:strand:+ start:259 stop:486 length:228 start_codon:yes stop_codon:yes gene_type:complete
MTEFSDVVAETLLMAFAKVPSANFDEDSDVKAEDAEKSSLTTLHEIGRTEDEVTRPGITLLTSPTNAVVLVVVDG